MVKIFLSHPNKEAYTTNAAHKYTHYIRKHSRFGVWLDTEHFPKKQITSEYQIKQILHGGLDRYSSLFQNQSTHPDGVLF